MPKPKPEQLRASSLLEGRVSRLKRLVELGAPDNIIEDARRLVLEAVDDFPTSSEARIGADAVDSLQIKEQLEAYSRARMLYESTGSRLRQWHELSIDEQRPFVEAAYDFVDAMSTMTAKH